MSEFKDYRLQIKAEVETALRCLLKEKNIKEDIPDLSLQRTPSILKGDIAFPLFQYSKLFKMKPEEIANSIALKLSFKTGVEGGFLNVFLQRKEYSKLFMQNILEENMGSEYLKGQKIVVEFSCPNTNKPLHLGHLRNDSLGESMARIFKACSAEVKRYNLINDRGVHICKTMLAYKKFADNKSPKDFKLKSDKFVGWLYTKYSELEKEDPSVKDEIASMLIKWEDGDSEILDLWKKMKDWAFEGISETYKKTGISFDKYYFESEYYKKGKEEVKKGLNKGIFQSEEDGAVYLNMEEIGLDKKIFIRADGTSLYITQDLGTLKDRYNDFNFDRHIYVVGSEQRYHFKALFFAIKKLNYPFADGLFHLSYGMVNLPDGKMKSREGTTVDADDLIFDLQELAKKEMVDKGRDSYIKDLDETSLKIALSALNYYLLNVTPSKDMLFDKDKSISFNGDTGPYIQYTGARISSILRKYEEQEGVVFDEKEYPNINFSNFELDLEWELLSFLMQSKDVLKESAKNYNPALITGYLYSLASLFNKFYHENPILSCEDKSLKTARLYLCIAIKKVLEYNLNLLNISFLDKM